MNKVSVSSASSCSGSGLRWNQSLKDWPDSMFLPYTKGSFHFLTLKENYPHLFFKNHLPLFLKRL